MCFISIGMITNFCDIIGMFESMQNKSMEDDTLINAMDEIHLAYSKYE